MMSGSHQVTRRIRVMAALLLVVASTSFGFLGGWLTARLVPVEGAAHPQIPIPSTANDQPHAQDKQVGTVALPADSQRGAAKAIAHPMQAQPANKELRQQAESQRDAQTIVPSEGMPQIRRSIHGATIINAGSAERRRATQEQDVTGSAAPDGRELARCERRYSSFRRSDGTYQPYGGGRRQRCPLLP